MLNTPVLFLIFNRPEHTRSVFERIRKIKPKFLFVAADGPRSTHLEDDFKCKEVRKIITSGVDWPCNVQTLYREKNLGCGTAPAEAISWFFDQVEEGIILEDDCLPDLTFFSYCETLLKYYRNSTQVMHISGNNLHSPNQRYDGSYCFSIYPHSWGWATWKRCWMMYDFSLKDYDRIDITNKLRLITSKSEVSFWISIFDGVVKNKPSDIWDYQWAYAVWRCQGLSILPTRNLVRNIGFNDQATHTISVSEELRNMKSYSITSIEHPKKIEVNRKADKFTFVRHFLKKGSRWREIKNYFLQFPIVKKTYTSLNNFFK